MSSWKSISSSDDDSDSGSSATVSVDSDGEVVYCVEKILQYRLGEYKNSQNSHGPNSSSYDHTLGEWKWEVRYLVKWKNYDKSWNSWEPRANFTIWTERYEAEILDLQKENPEWGDHDRLLREADERNEDQRRKRARAAVNVQRPSSSRVVMRLKTESVKTESVVIAMVPTPRSTRRNSLISSTSSGSSPASPDRNRVLSMAFNDDPSPPRQSDSPLEATSSPVLTKSPASTSNLAVVNRDPKRARSPDSPQLQPSKSPKLDPRPLSSRYLRGCTTLNEHDLKIHLSAVDYLRAGEKEGYEVVIRRAWGIPNPVENWGEKSLETVLGGKESMIYAPLEGKIGTRDGRSGKGVKSDCYALKYLLLKLNAKLRDGIGEALEVLYVHVSEEKEFGKAVELQDLRRRSTKDLTVVLFGLRNSKDKTGLFRKVWSTAAAITITPSAFLQAPVVASALIKYTSQSKSEGLERTENYFWVPSPFFFRDGPFPLPPCEKSRLPSETIPEESYSKATILLHQLVQNGYVSLAAPVPSSSTSSSHSFPANEDISPYKDSSLRTIEEWITPSIGKTDLSSIQKRTNDWKSVYSQVRQWIIVVSEEELSTADHLPGITLVTLDQAQQLFSLPS